jgi:hypothetical protein
MEKRKNYIWKEDQLILKDVCFECGITKETGKIHYHHVVPISKGGTRAIPMCDECHSKVHGTHMLKMQKLAAITRSETIRKRKEQGLHSGMGKPMGHRESKEKFLSKHHMAIDMINDGKTNANITEITGVSPTTISKIIKTIGYVKPPIVSFSKKQKNPFHKWLNVTNN